MPITKFSRIKNWSKKGPVVTVKFEILDKNREPLGDHTEQFLFDSGSEGGIILSNSYLQDYNLNVDELLSLTVISPGNAGILQKACLIIIHEIIVNKQNILEKSLHNIELIFSSNDNQTPVIGQNCFLNFECCINYKKEKFKIEKQ